MSTTKTASVSTIDLAYAETAAEIRVCFEVMRELRPHLASAEEFTDRVAGQKKSGYRLLAGRDVSGRVVACAGFRVCENLMHGRHLYVDDLVTLDTERARGHGERLFHFVLAEARATGCEKVVLDTGLSNALAHRFYFRQGMLATALRFTLPTKPQPPTAA
jgi:ribosomal protein S18 acetylase RimI-like enzyme